MTVEIQKIKGQIASNVRDVNRLLERRVSKNNDTSGKITVPTTLINKKVYVVWLEE